jgi:hypothetical protein
MKGSGKRYYWLFVGTNLTATWGEWGRRRGVRNSHLLTQYFKIQ